MGYSFFCTAFVGSGLQEVGRLVVRRESPPFNSVDYCVPLLPKYSSLCPTFSPKYEDEVFIASAVSYSRFVEESAAVLSEVIVEITPATI